MTCTRILLIASLFIFSCSASEVGNNDFRDVSEDAFEDLKVSDASLDSSRHDVGDMGQDLADAHNDATPLPVTELQKYVRMDDGEFKYELVKKDLVNQYQQYIFYVTSQKWQSEADVDRPIWTLDIFMIVPPNVASRAYQRI